ncbi:MAG: RCC1 domain-containing protein [Myxococcota bacterium]
MKKVGIAFILMLGCSVDRNGGGDAEGGNAGASGNKTGGAGSVPKGGSNSGGRNSGGSNSGGALAKGGTTGDAGNSSFAGGGADESGGTSGEGGTSANAGGTSGSGGVLTAGGSGGTLTTSGGATNGGTGGGVTAGGKAATGGTGAGGTAMGGTGAGGKAAGGTTSANGGTGTGGKSSCPGGGTPKARDCTSSADNDCDGKADNTIDTVCTCVVGQVQTCDTHPGSDGKGTCKAGTQTCVAGTGNSTTGWGTCQGAVGPTIEACTANGLDEDCDGLYNETPPCAERYEQVSAGTFTTCGVALNGSVLCWGRNESGQLGQGFTDTSAHTSAVSVTVSKAAEVAVGTTHACARLFNGTVRCWGGNQFGQLGNGTKTNSSNPVMVTGLENVTRISVGSMHSCAVRSDGTAACWGAGDWGILGNRSTTGSTTPTAVVGLGSIAAIAAEASNSTCALLTNGTVYCWGDDLHGELGNGSADGNSGSLIPVQVTGLTGITQLNGSIARKSDTNTLWFWGENEYGQAGTGEKSTGGPITIEYYAPVQVSSITIAKQASRGGQSTCAVMNDGTVRCWGTNNNGSLGVGSSASSFTPVSVPGLSGVASLDCGSDGHCCAVLNDGSLRCWGNNQYGQLGDGTTTNRLAPVAGPTPY